MTISGSPNSTGSPFLDQYFLDRAGMRRGDLVHGLHRLDDHDGLAGLHLLAHVDERCRFRRGRMIAGADHRGLYGAGGSSTRFCVGCSRRRLGSWRSLSNRCRRCNGGVLRRRGSVGYANLARHAHLQAIVFHFDFGQPGVGEYLRENADLLVVERLGGLAHVWIRLVVVLVYLLSPIRRLAASSAMM
jgi:hypothetical protein